jgi:hypothetical protein
MVVKQFAAANSAHVKPGDGQLQPPPQKRPKGGPMKKQAFSKRKFWQSIVAVIAVVLGLMVPTAVPSVQPTTTTRPISDFVNAQGTFCFPDGAGGCLIFVPPIPNFLGWGDLRTGNCASVDYAGLADATYGGVFGTQTSGIVVERPLPDGRAEVTVTLHTTKALTWVIEGCSDFAGGTLLFGHRAPDVLAGADAALGDSFFEISFINTAPGAPLPDLMQLFSVPAPGQEFHQYVFRANAKGTLRSAFGVPDGTPGMVTVAETGNIARSNIQAALVNLRKTGN